MCRPEFRRAFVLALLLVLPCLVRAEEPAVRVAVYGGEGTSKSLKSVLSVLLADPALKVTTVGVDEIRAGKLAGFDVLLHPGGSGSKQGLALGEEGRAREREFVRGGGGFVGVCAGAYLATRDYPWSLHVLDARVIDRAHWARGTGPVDIALTPRGRDLLGLSAEKQSIYYHQGPLLAPADDPELPDYEPLARFEGDIAKNGAPKGVMPGATAIAAARFGKGHVICFSPHPELTEGLGGILRRGVTWAAGREATAGRAK